MYYTAAGGPIAWYRLRRRPFELCARGTTPESLSRLCAAPDRPSQRPTAGLGPRPVLYTRHLNGCSTFYGRDRNKYFFFHNIIIHYENIARASHHIILYCLKYRPSWSTSRRINNYYFAPSKNLSTVSTSIIEKNIFHSAAYSEINFSWELY